MRIQNMALGPWNSTALAHAEDGQDLIEYALLAGLIAMVAVGAVTALGTTVRDTFWTVIASSIP